MNNLSFEELKALSESVAEQTLLEQISGGTANNCHDDPEPNCPPWCQRLPYPDIDE